MHASTATCVSFCVAARPMSAGRCSTRAFTVGLPTGFRHDVTGVDNPVVNVYANLFDRVPSVSNSGVQYWAQQICIANGATSSDVGGVARDDGGTSSLNDLESALCNLLNATSNDARINNIDWMPTKIAWPVTRSRMPLSMLLRVTCRP
jgi:hypothetical protein